MPALTAAAPGARTLTRLPQSCVMPAGVSEPAIHAAPGPQGYRAPPRHGATADAGTHGAGIKQAGGGGRTCRPSNVWLLHVSVPLSGTLSVARTCAGSSRGQGSEVWRVGGHGRGRKGRRALRRAGPPTPSKQASKVSTELRVAWVLCLCCASGWCGAVRCVHARAAGPRRATAVGTSGQQYGGEAGRAAAVELAARRLTPRCAPAPRTPALSAAPSAACGGRRWGQRRGQRGVSS